MVFKPPVKSKTDNFLKLKLVYQTTLYNLLKASTLLQTSSHKLNTSWMIKYGIHTLNPSNINLYLHQKTT